MDILMTSTNYMKIVTLCAAFLGSTVLNTLIASEQEEIGISLPGIPIKVSDPNPKEVSHKKYQKSENAPISKANILKTPANKNSNAGERAVDKLRITVSPGINEILPISRGYLNRFVTPFSQPKVLTVNNVETTIRDNVVYVTTRERNPVGLFITDGDEQTAVSLTLIPKAIAPVEVTLNVKSMLTTKVNKNAKKWEESQPYVDVITDLLSNIALEEVPQGYAMSSVNDEEKHKYKCAFGIYGAEPMQILDGHNYKAIIYAFRNDTDKEIEIVESNCYSPGVRAVAAWPSLLVPAGKATEVYVVYDKLHVMKSNRIQRPSVIETNYVDMEAAQ